MNDVLKPRYKVGEIEFEAEGSAEAVEQQRINFMNAVLPAAVDAIVRTHTVVEQQAYVEAAKQPTMLETGVIDDSQTVQQQTENDYSRTSLASFLKQFGPLSEQDFTLFSAFLMNRKIGKSLFQSMM